MESRHVNSWESSLQKNQSLQTRPDWFEVALPVAALPLIFILLLILPIFLLTAESLLAPVYDFIHSLLMPVNAGMTYASLPILLVIKILIFALFTFTGVALLLLKISCIYNEVWSYFVQSPNPKHAPYHPDQQESMVALFNWNMFRWYKVLGVPIGWVVLTILSGTFFLWFFNAFTDFGFFTFQLQITLGLFVLSVLGFFTAIEAAKGIGGALTTILGDVAAITEPEKPAQVLYERAKKLAFTSPWSLILYPLYFVFYLMLIVEIVLLIAQYDIQDITSFNPDILMIFVFEILTLVVFVILNGLKFMTYHDALVRFYQQNSR
jgi:hypothetical protein